MSISNSISIKRQLETINNETKFELQFASLAITIASKYRNLSLDISSLACNKKFKLFLSISDTHFLRNQTRWEIWFRNAYELENFHFSPSKMRNSKLKKKESFRLEIRIRIFSETKQDKKSIQTRICSKTKQDEKFEIENV